MNKPIGKEVNEVARDIRKFLHYHLDEYSLGDGQFGILYEVSKNEGISQEYIRKIRNVDKATIAKAVKKLIDNGYIYRERDTEDKRAYCLYCTQKGRDFIPEIEKIIALEQEIVTKGLTPEELNIFTSVLRKITLNIREFFEGEEKKI